MSIKTKYKAERTQIEMFLGEIGDLLARHSGFVKRQSKFGGTDLIQVMTLGCLTNGMSTLETFCQVASELGIEISSSGFHQRLTTEAVELLRAVCQRWMQQSIEQQSSVGVLSQFNAVRIIDSSRIQLPAELADHFPGTRTDATMKVQLAYEYHCGQIEAVVVEGERCPDHHSTLPQTLGKAGDLTLFDLGYFDQNRFAELAKQDIYFISRLQSQAGLYHNDDPNQKVDILDYLAQLPDHVLFGEQVLRLGRKQKLPVRVVYYRVPPLLAQQRRRKAKQNARKRGQTYSQHLLDWQDWLIFITNVPLDLLPTEQIATVYRVRWQIEILFKVWKQEMHWGTMRQWRFERVMCQFYARCLALVLFHRLVALYRANADWELSWTKALQRLKSKVVTLIHIVRHRFRGLLSFLERLGQDFRRFARKSQRQKLPSTYTLLERIYA